MDVNLTAEAELQARKAESLQAFGGLNLLYVKRQVDLLLGLIGRDGIFDEYTQHDISHVDESLKLLEWLIPSETKAIMSPADWLLLVLAVYFHDLGMLVTKREYELRDDSGFPEYRDNVLYGGDKGEDYKAKVSSLPDEDAERFLYQEFVREKHAERIRNWVLGKAVDHLGVADDAVSAVDELLKPLGQFLRGDLGLVCESHHLTDLYDLRKYKIAQPYGNSEPETANVQYCAIMLRVVDLLQITSKRTPSIVFKVINPTDPMSQQEWVKQMGVRNVRSKVACDEDGHAREDLPRDTIEAHANFDREDAFFGLTSYLIYAGDQIRKSCEWAQLANKEGARHRFPWRYIDDSNVETEGFIKTPFEFAIDQPKVLDLLTGHTLYNDTRVVIRELVQNALDAVRFQHFLDSREDSSAQIGKVSIRWDSGNRVLSVEDNGVGMTQAVIEENLLKVGSSLYQDPEFRRKFPYFSPISRFGIGILSTFMIADTVEIYTCHPDDGDARYLSLRSVYGKYLIRLLDKNTDEVARRLKPHGTLVKLTIRPSADIQDVIETAKRWIVIPRCEVSVLVDDSPPVTVGYNSPKAALEDDLISAGMVVVDGPDGASGGQVRVLEVETNNVTVAYAVRWSQYFKEWSFVVGTEQLGDHPSSGMCVEGVRLESGTPGIPGYPFAAVADARGPAAPKTNVVRSSLELTPERDALLRNLYSAYCRHVENEIRELHEKRGFSTSWAVRESRWLLDAMVPPLLGEEDLTLDEMAYHGLGRIRLQGEEPGSWDLAILREELERLPVLLVEEGGRRQAVSVAALREKRRFWTIDCEQFRAAELVISEARGEVSLSSLLGAVETAPLLLPDEPILCQTHGRGEGLLFTDREPNAVSVNPEMRRVDVGWVEKANPPRWRAIRMTGPIRRFARYSQRGAQGSLGCQHIRVGQGEVEFSGLSGEIAVRAFQNFYIVPECQLAGYLVSLLDSLEAEPDLRRAHTTVAVLDMVLDLLATRGALVGTPELVEEQIRHFLVKAQGERESVLPRVDMLREVEGHVDLAKLTQTIKETKWKVFDQSAWRRGKREED